RPVVTARTFLGLPFGVSHTVQLQRRIDSEEWDRLVVQLRDVFNARWRVRVDGSLRQWTNGNLHVLLEPTQQGDRLRFGAVNGGARASIALGLVSLALAGILAIANAAAGTLPESALAIGGLVGWGLIVIGNRALRLPGWARLRARQMQSL